MHILIDCYLNIELVLDDDFLMACKHTINIIIFLLIRHAPKMIDKNEIFCLKIIEKGPFFEEYLVCKQSSILLTKTYFSLRTMKKSLIAQNNNDEELVMFELMIRTNLRHPFLINQVCAFQDYDNLYYMTEYAPIKLLKSNMLPKNFSLPATKFYVAEIFLCLRYIHSKKQTYTFLCPENIFLCPDGHVKLDYSFCNCLEYNNNGINHNIEFVSLDYIENNTFTYLSDFWSMGIVLYLMVFGFTPFSGKDAEDVITKIIKNKPYISEFTDSYTSDLISLLLNRSNFHNRPSCKELEDRIMAHPFFHEIDWELLEKKQIKPPYSIEIPDYDLNLFPKLSSLYTSDFIVGDKDGYGKIFSKYNTVHFLLNK